MDAKTTIVNVFIWGVIVIGAITGLMVAIQGVFSFIMHKLESKNKIKGIEKK